MTDPLQQLVERASHGDALAVDQLLERTLPSLGAFVRLRCGPVLRAHESASDIVQSACRDVLGQLDKFRWNGESGFRAWLFTAAMRKIADRAEYWKAQKRDSAREVRLVTRDDDGDTRVADVYRTVCTPSQVAVGRELMERIERAFESLTDEQREVIALARIAGLSHADIAQRMGWTEVNARQKLYRALAALSEVLDGGEGSGA